MTNRRGQRDVTRVDRDSLHTIWADTGIRPSDLLQNDIVVLVEGPKDAVFLDYVINTLFASDFGGVSVGVIQYGGASAEGIIGGHIEVRNITSAQGYALWIRDRDAKPGDQPSTNATQFANALQRGGQVCHILSQREIEWYLPESLYVEAQEGDRQREEAVKAILHGTQEQKFADSAPGICVPTGKYLRDLLPKHVTRDNLHSELKGLVEDHIVRWRNEIIWASLTGPSARR